MEKKPMNIESRLAQIGSVQPVTGAVNFPIYQATACRHPKLGQSTGFDYARTKIRPGRYWRTPAPSWNPAMPAALGHGAFRRFCFVRSRGPSDCIAGSVWWHV